LLKDKNERVRNRFIEIILRNSDLQFFINFNILKWNVNDKYFDYAPLTSVGVQKSFSNLRHLLCERKSKMTIETLKTILFLYFNKQ
jgi:hypothetical protein